MFGLRARQIPELNAIVTTGKPDGAVSRRAKFIRSHAGNLGTLQLSAARSMMLKVWWQRQNCNLNV